MCLRIHIIEEYTLTIKKARAKKGNPVRIALQTVFTA